MLLMPLVNAVTLNNTLINATGGITINVTDNIYFDTLIIQSNSIYFQNIRASDSATEKLTYNITSLGNYTEDDLPYISSSISTSKVISSNITINASITVDVDDCSNINSLSYRSNTGLYTDVSSCTSCVGDLLTCTKLTVESSTNNNVLSIVYSSAVGTNKVILNTGIRTMQSSIVGMVSNFFALMPAIGTILAIVILIAGIVILIVYVSRMNNPDGKEPGTYTG